MRRAQSFLEMTQEEGNNVRDENSHHALFDEPGSSPKCGNMGHGSPWKLWVPSRNAEVSDVSLVLGHQSEQLAMPG